MKPPPFVVHRRRANGWRVLAVAAALAAAALAAAAPARAADAAVPGDPLSTYRRECGSCHLAYPPGLLPAASWQRLTANLPKHFGTDASLDAATLAPLQSWLAANAGTSKKVRRDPSPPPDDRITRAGWFVREHREAPASTLALPAVRSMSNCAACHTRADQGDFDERFVRLPR